MGFMLMCFHSCCSHSPWTARPVDHHDMIAVLKPEIHQFTGLSTSGLHITSMRAEATNSIT